MQNVPKKIKTQKYLKGGTLDLLLLITLVQPTGCGHDSVKRSHIGIDWYCKIQFLSLCAVSFFLSAFFHFPQGIIKSALLLPSLTLHLLFPFRFLEAQYWRAMTGNVSLGRRCTNFVHQSAMDVADKSSLNLGTIITALPCAHLTLYGLKTVFMGKLL